MFRKTLDFLLFSNLWTALIAISLLYQTTKIHHISLSFGFYAFIFFATWGTYSLHWLLTPLSISGENPCRLFWTLRNKGILKAICVLSLFFGGYFSVATVAFLPYFLPAFCLTILYIAPQFPFRPFIYLRGWAYAKTLYLAMVWVYVGVFLPILVQESVVINLAFCLNRFLLLLLICILFDFRDRESDQQKGIKSWVTYSNETQIIRACYVLSVVYLLTLCFLPAVSVFFLPIMLYLRFFKKLLSNHSDYWYYGFLDGLLVIFIG